MSVDVKFQIRRDDFSLTVDISIPERGITSLLGPSGSGKTTLLRAIAGLERHQDGLMKVGDMVWQDTDHFVPPHRRSLGYVFQEASLFAHLDVRRNLEYGLRRVPLTLRKVSLENAIELLGLEQLLSRLPHTLSGGERQRVAIARALAVSPRLLLMDEPLAGLDVKRKKEILPYIESFNAQLDIPVIYVSHSPDEVARLADYLVLLGDGNVIATGDIREMMTRLDLPLSHDSDAEALIEANVVQHDDEFDLTYLDFPGGRFTVTRQPLPLGHPVRLRVSARDVSLTLEHQSGTSIQNIFPAVIDDMMVEGKGQVTVRLLAQGVPLLARVTRKSVIQLDLKPGKRVYAQAKSVALLA
jgi:molybdate transport system ATP-binding protein